MHLIPAYRIFLAALTLSAFAAGTASAAPLEKGELKREDLKNYFAIQHQLDPSTGDQYKKMLRMFGEKDTYTAAEVTAVTDPDAAKLHRHDPVREEQMGKPPRDTFAREALRQRFALMEQRDPGAKGLYETLVGRFGQRDWYLASQVRDVEEHPVETPPTPEEVAEAKAVRKALTAGKVREFQSREGWRTPRIRRDWRDVLYDEDPSQDDTRDKALGDLVGATLSYTRDGRADTDTWAAQGALILPYTRHFDSDAAFSLTQFAAAPSVSINRLSTNGDPAVETDTVLYRLGLYFDFYGTTRLGAPKEMQEDGGYAERPYHIQVRAAGVYVSDMDNRAGLRGYEADVELRYVNSVLPIGYKKILIKKHPLQEDRSDNSHLEYQLRAWLHIEGGEVQDAGEAWAATTEPFFRWGPTLQFQLTAPSLPGGRALSLTALYSYLAAEKGPSDHEWYFRSTLSYDLYKGAEENHAIKINADYQRGGLNFTKEEVDSFTIGLGVLF